MMFDDPLSFLSIVIWLAAASMWPVGFLFGVCSECVDCCGVRLSFERCMRVENVGGFVLNRLLSPINNEVIGGFRGGHCRIFLAGPGERGEAPFVEGNGLRVVDSPARITVPIQITLSAAGGSRTPVGVTRTQTWRFNQANIPDSTACDIVGPPWHLQVDLEVIGVATAEEAGVETEILLDIYEQPLLFVRVMQHTTAITHTRQVTLFPVGFQRSDDSTFRLTSSLRNATLVAGTSVSGWSVSKAAGITVEERATTLRLSAVMYCYDRVQTANGRNFSVFNSVTAVNFLNGVHTIRLPMVNQATNPDEFFQADFRIDPPSLLCGRANLGEGIALGIYPMEVSALLDEYIPGWYTCNQVVRMGYGWRGGDSWGSSQLGVSAAEFSFWDGFDLLWNATEGPARQTSFVGGGNWLGSAYNPTPETKYVRVGLQTGGSLRPRDSSANVSGCGVTASTVDWTFGELEYTVEPTGHLSTGCPQPDPIVGASLVGALRFVAIRKEPDPVFGILSFNMVMIYRSTLPPRPELVCSGGAATPSISIIEWREGALGQGNVINSPPEVDVTPVPIQVTISPLPSLPSCGAWQPSQQTDGLFTRTCSVAGLATTWTPERNTSRLPRYLFLAGPEQATGITQAATCQMRRLRGLSNPAVISGTVGAGACFIDSPLVEGETLRAPGPPRNLAVGRPDCSTAVLSWLPPLIDGRYPVVRYEAQFRLSTSSTWTSGSPPLNNIQALTVTIVGLATAGYFFRVRAVSFDPSPWVEVSSNDWQPAAPQLLPVQREACDSAIVSWVPPTTSQCIPLAGYRVQLRQPLVTSTWTEAPGGDLAPDATAATLTGLLPNVAYEFRVGAFRTNGRNVAAFSTPVRIGLPPTAPTNLLVVALPATGHVSIVWDHTQETCFDVSFLVQFRRVTPPASSSFTTFATVGTAVRSSLVTGLIRGVVYRFRVVTQNPFTPTAFVESADVLIPEG